MRHIIGTLAAAGLLVSVGATRTVAQATGGETTPTCGQRSSTTITSGTTTTPVTQVTGTNGSTSTTVYQDSNNNVVRAEETNAHGDFIRVEYYVQNFQPFGGLAERSHRVIAGPEGTVGSHNQIESDGDSAAATYNAREVAKAC
jgi:hypothetical protein